MLRRALDEGQLPADARGAPRRDGARQHAAGRDAAIDPATGLSVWEFQATPVMSTYLNAWVIGACPRLLEAYCTVAVFESFVLPLRQAMQMRMPALP